VTARRSFLVPRRLDEGGRNTRADRGVILLETALVVVLLLTLVVATFEVGMGWRSSITNSNAARAGARVESYQGTGYQADYSALLSVNAGLTSVSRASITRVIVFKATSGSSTVPASCLALTPSVASSTPTGVNTATVKCNVYSGTQIANIASGSITSTSFGNGSNTSAACTNTKLDYYWCPFGRSNDQAAGLDYVGVYVEIKHASFSRMFGSTFTIKDTEIMQIEPSATGA
jgi:Flp pilus assembly protein TadG